MFDGEEDEEDDVDDIFLVVQVSHLIEFCIFKQNVNASYWFCSLFKIEFFSKQPTAGSL